MSWDTAIFLQNLLCFRRPLYNLLLGYYNRLFMIRLWSLLRGSNKITFVLILAISLSSVFMLTVPRQCFGCIRKKKVREKFRECHNHKQQPFPDTKRKRKPTNPNKRKSNKRTKSTKISSLFPKRGNRNAKRTEKHKNNMTQGKT